MYREKVRNSIDLRSRICGKFMISRNDIIAEESISDRK